MFVKISLKIMQCAHTTIKEHTVTHPYWKKYRNFALSLSADTPFELAACYHFSEWAEQNTARGPDLLGRNNIPQMGIPAMSSPEEKKTNKLS